MKRAGKWALGAALTAVGAFAVYQSASAPVTQPTTLTAEFTEPAVVTEAPPAEQPCGYQWAYEDMPELTAEFDSAVKALNSSASGRAQAFGENCVRADGTSTFGAMETDFYVSLPVDDLGNEEEFGNWISQVMEVVTQIPREKLEGPNYGFVEFTLEKSESERIIFRASIQKYLDEAQGKSGAELFRMFYTP
jgi:hypothetical protein